MHIIKADEYETEDEHDDEPLVAVFPSKGMEKVLTDEESDDDQDNIYAEIEAVATRATQTVVEKKNLLDIIVKITFGETTIATPPVTTTQKPHIKSPNQTPKVSNKRKEAQPSGDAAAMQASEEPETKRAKYDQPAPQEVINTPQTSQSKKKKKLIAATCISLGKSAQGGAPQQ